MAVPGMIGGVAESLQMSLSMLLAARLGPANSVAIDLTMNIEMIVGACVSGVRYALHNYSVQRHGWHARGLSDAGEAFNGTSPCGILQIVWKSLFRVSLSRGWMPMGLTSARRPYLLPPL